MYEASLRKDRNVSNRIDICNDDSNIHLYIFNLGMAHCFLCKDEEEVLEKFYKVLKVFEISLGLKINCERNQLCGMNIPFAEVKIVAEILGCKACNFQISYLGMALGDSLRRFKFWKLVMEKVLYKLENLKKFPLKQKKMIVKRSLEIFIVISCQITV